MKYEELREFIIHQMKPDKSDGIEKNYQPVVIKLLNQSEGSATREEIIESLKRENPNRELPQGVLKTVTDTLIRNNIITSKDNSFHLLDFDSFTTQEKAWITMYCDEKINNSQSTRNYFLIQISKFGSPSLLQKNYYEHLDWFANKGHSDHGKVKVGDLIMFYFTGNAIDYQKTLKKIYKVDSVTDNNIRFSLSLYQELNGLSLHQIKDFVKNGILQNNTFGHIGKEYFNICQISKSEFDTILELDSPKLKINDNQFKIAHELFKKYLLEKSQIEFTGFEHPSMLKDEINYKRKILDDTKHLRILDNWKKEWIYPNQVIQQLLEACLPKVSSNLLMGANYGVQTSSAASLLTITEDKKQDYEEILRKFFITAISDFSNVGKNFDEIIEFAKKENLKVDWRFLSYLAFIANPEKFIHVHPTNFEILFKFYKLDIKLRGNFSWEIYSQVLQIVKQLKEKLNNYGQLDNVQIHSYIWVTASALNKTVSTNYWLIRAGTNGMFWDSQIKNNFVGISYYKIKNLPELLDTKNDPDNKNLRDIIDAERNYQQKENLTDKEFESILEQFREFLKINIGDKVIAISDNSTLLGAGEITGNFKFDPNYDNSQTYPINWFDTKKRTIPTISFRKTIKALTPEEYENMMSEKSQNSDLSEYEKYFDVLERKKQLIFYGPPGTGKTFHSVLLAQQFTKNNSSIPQKMTFRSAIIKTLKESGQPMHYTDITKEILDKGLVQTSGETPHFTVVKEMSKDIQNKGEHSIFVKTDKGTYRLNSDSQEYEIKFNDSITENPLYVRSVTFHQSYSYEEFIEGIRPHTVKNHISYELEDGIFKQIVEYAKADPLNRYVLLIDEINRGNISKIFGELITLIEKDKRDKHQLQLAYSKEDFSVPSNLYIIGTMNTADRSLVQIDAALRRRFAFCELMPKPELLTQSIEGVSLQELLITLNQRISKEGLREKQIGHSYLMGVNNLKDLHFVFTHEIVPLLQDYFFDDYKKLENDILSADFVDSENMLIKEDWQENPNRFLDILKTTFPQ